MKDGNISNFISEEKSAIKPMHSRSKLEPLMAADPSVNHLISQIITGLFIQHISGLDLGTGRFLPVIIAIKYLRMNPVFS